MESKIRNLENDTPKSAPENFGNGTDERKNLSEPNRRSSVENISKKPPTSSKARRKISKSKSLKDLKSMKDLSTRSLPSTPVKKMITDPLAPRSHQMIDYEEISERIRDLEATNDTLLDDNRTLSEGFLQKEKGMEELTERIAELTKENTELKDLAKKKDILAEKKNNREIEKEKEIFRKKIKQLDEEQIRDKAKIKQELIL